MSVAHLLHEMQVALRDAERLFRNDNYAGSVECYNKALQLCSLLPLDTAFDRHRFDASCQAGLSAVYGRLDKPFESFAAANSALLFYDKCGEKYPADIGRWLMAIVNQGTALAAFRCFTDAQVAFMRAKEIFFSKGLNTPQNKQWLDMVNGNIALLSAHLIKEP
ncbi:MAG: tetratricopeptide repeat protein [Nitrososphaerota archaeon]|nr:tetratricopeptide repeat protein [Nitrososphaerota archaeon]